MVAAVVVVEAVGKWATASFGSCPLVHSPGSHRFARDGFLGEAWFGAGWQAEVYGGRCPISQRLMEAPMIVEVEIGRQ